MVWTLTQLTTGGDVDHGITIAGTPFSHDGAWICYDCARGMIRDASVIARVNTNSREVIQLYDAKSTPGKGPGVAAVRYFPDASDRVIFIHGPHAETGLNYERWRRYGAILDTRTGKATFADARDVTPPYTPGALRGGTHVHVPGGPQNQWIGFTYDDMVMRSLGEKTGQNWDLRTIGVTRLGIPVRVDPSPENWSGDGFSVVLAPVTPNPKPDTDELKRAEGECWVGDQGYLRDGKRRFARAFVGTLGNDTLDIFVVDIPDDDYAARAPSR